MKYYIKVKNILGKDKKIPLLNGTTYTIKNRDEKIIGEYSEDVNPIIFKLLKTGFEVSKVLEEHIQDYMLIDTNPECTQTVPDDKKEPINDDISNTEEKPKKRRGRPPKKK